MKTGVFTCSKCLYCAGPIWHDTYPGDVEKDGKAVRAETIAADEPCRISCIFHPFEVKTDAYRSLMCKMFARGDRLCPTNFAQKKARSMSV